MRGSSLYWSTILFPRPIAPRKASPQQRRYRIQVQASDNIKVEGPPEAFDHRSVIALGASQIIETHYPQLLDLAQKGETLVCSDVLVFQYDLLEDTNFLACQ